MKLKFQNSIFAILLLFPLSGCAENIWFKPNAKHEDFQRDKYNCLQESQQSVSRERSNSYGSYAVNQLQTNEQLFASCMNALGWQWQNRDDVESYISAKRENNDIIRSEFIQAMEQHKARQLDLCSSSEFKEYYAKTACKASEINFSQLADNSKITKAQKAALLKQRDAIAELQKELIDININYRGKNSQKDIDILNNITTPQNEANNLDLYNGNVTWGIYNQRRKDIYIQSVNARKEQNQTN